MQTTRENKHWNNFIYDPDLGLCVGTTSLQARHRMFSKAIGKWQSVMPAMCMCVYALSKRDTYLHFNIFSGSDKAISSGKFNILQMRGM